MSREDEPYQYKSSIHWVAAFAGVMAWAAIVIAVFAPPVHGQSDNDHSRVQAENLPGDVVGKYQRLVGIGVGQGQRTEAASQLLHHGSAESVQALSSALSPGQQPGTWVAVFEAVTTAMDDPPTGLGLPVFSLMTRVRQRHVDDWAAAMGRFKHGQWRDELERIADHRQAAIGVRLRAIAALGHYREPSVAEHLMALTRPDKPARVQQAAFEALADLSGIARYGADRRAWNAWWDQAREQSDDDWQRALVANFARRRASGHVKRGHLKSRLLEAQRALYRTTSSEDRPAVLGYMLDDSLLPIRMLGMDFVQQRLVDGKAFAGPLRKALRARLSDASPVIRKRAALRLRDLADELAADRIARRLAHDTEQVTDVLEADLLMMASLPRAQAVASALEMLDRPQLRDEAAAALASAHKRQMLSKEQISQMQQTLRDYLQAHDNRFPPPELVTLLARVGNPRDWNRIAGWVDQANPAVKRAAAQAWADSGRSLKLLAERAGDPVIEPIAISAAIQGGDDPRTLTSLAQHRPDRNPARLAWARALVALAGRVPNPATLEAVRSLADRRLVPQTRARMLTAAIEQARGTAENSAVWLRLILWRANNRLAVGKPALAVADFERLVGEDRQLTDRQEQQRDRGLVKAYLQAGEEEESFTAARRLLGTAGNGRLAQPNSDDPVVDLFLDAATRHASNGRPDEARSVLAGLRNLLGPSLKPEIAQRIHSVEQSTVQSAESDGPSTTRPPPDQSPPPTQTSEQPLPPTRAAGNR